MKRIALVSAVLVLLTTIAVAQSSGNFTAQVLGGDISVLEEVERREDNAKHTYEDALKSDLPADVLPVVQQQAETVFSAHARVKRLRDEAKRAA